MVYKRCIVPDCSNTSTRTPGKIFFHLPTQEALRLKWQTSIENAMKIKGTSLSKNLSIHFGLSSNFCCEDHFIIEDDVENFPQSSMVGIRMKLKSDVVPHKFDCETMEESPSIERALTESSNFSDGTTESDNSNDCDNHVPVNLDIVKKEIGETEFEDELIPNTIQIKGEPLDFENEEREFDSSLVHNDQLIADIMRLKKEKGEEGEKDDGNVRKTRMRSGSIAKRFYGKAPRKERKAKVFHTVEKRATKNQTSEAEKTDSSQENLISSANSLSNHDRRKRPIKQASREVDETSVAKKFYGKAPRKERKAKIFHTAEKRPTKNQTSEAEKPDNSQENLISAASNRSNHVEKRPTKNQTEAEKTDSSQENPISEANSRSNHDRRKRPIKQTSREVDETSVAENNNKCSGDKMAESEESSSCQDNRSKRGRGRPKRNVDEEWKSRWDGRPKRNIDEEYRGPKIDKTRVTSIRSSNRLRPQNKPKEKAHKASKYERPPYSYVCLAALAIKNSIHLELVERAIYQFIRRQFPYYKSERNFREKLNKILNESEYFHSRISKGIERWTWHPDKHKEMNKILCLETEHLKHAILRAMAQPQNLWPMMRGRLHLDTFERDESSISEGEEADDADSGSLGSGRSLLKVNHKKDKRNVEERRLTAHEDSSETESDVEVKDQPSNQQDDDESDADYDWTNENRCTQQLIQSLPANDEELDGSDISLVDFDISEAYSMYNKSEERPSSEPVQKLSPAQCRSLLDHNYCYKQYAGNRPSPPSTESEAEAEIAPEGERDSKESQTATEYSISVDC